MKLKIEAVDPSSMRAVRDITPLISSDSAGYIERSTSNELIESGEVGYAGHEQWLSHLIRIYADDTDTLTCLGTFFATPQDCTRVGKLIQGKIQLDSTMLALSSTMLPSTYVAASGASSSVVIADMCKIAGRATKLDPSLGNSRYTESIFYEAGSTCLAVAQEAAKRAGVKLGTDRFGYITTEPTSENPGAGQSWTTLISQTDIISVIKKSSSWYTSPTRVIATYTDTDTTLSASASIPASERDAQTRGRHVDATINVTDITDPSPATLRGEALKALASSGVGDDWTFTSAFRDIDAGAPGRVQDAEAGEILTGTITQVKVSLTPLMPVSITIRGEVR